MASTVQIAWQSWTFPVWLTLTLAFAALVYLRGWLHLRSVSANAIPAWRAASFSLGLFLIWVAVGSPLAALDEELLTFHMVQHLLLMTLAPPLILVSAPVMPLLHGLPRQFVQGILGPLFRWPAIEWLGRVFAQPAFCWLAAAAALVGWHVPAAFTLALRSEAWHVIEHASFLGTGLLFWWPVVQPWPTVPAWPRWWIVLYIFLATLPCDILSAFLVFSDRVVYPAYSSAPRYFGISLLEDQECAGALMWTCVTVVYLVPAAILTTRLLGAQNSIPAETARPALSSIATPQNEPQRVEAH
jgi:putative membrane protein